MINEIEDKFGKMVVNRGKEHSFIGLDMKIKHDGTVKMSTKEYIRENILAFDETAEK